MSANYLNENIMKRYLSQSMSVSSSSETLSTASPFPLEAPSSDVLSVTETTLAATATATATTLESASMTPTPQDSNDKRKKMPLKRMKSETKKETRVTERPKIRFSDLGGIDHCIKDIHEYIERPLFYSEIYFHLGIEPPRGVLLTGPSGCGKTFLANAIAGEYAVPFIKLSAPEIVSGMSGESESKIREIFDSAKSLAPCLIFIDEIDAIATKRELAQKEMEKRIVSQLLSCMDELSYCQPHDKPVIVLGATSRPETLDPSLRRAGRFDHEIKMTIPNELARESIMKIQMAKLKVDSSVDVMYIARHTPGYAAADLKMLIREAAIQGIKRIFGDFLGSSESHLKDRMEIESGGSDGGGGGGGGGRVDETGATPHEMEQFSEEPVQRPKLSPEMLSTVSVCMADFTVAMGKVTPSAKREGFAVVPDVTWADIGALTAVREELRLAVVEPLVHPELFSAVGIASPAGVLLWGPPGCGKTLLAKAVANESHSNFISVKGPELLNKYVGESEKAVRQVFERARSSAPCVIFFDELDALCPKRNEDANAYSARVVNQLLTEMDGLEGRQQVYIIGATNRPDIIDPAMLRPGRLDKLVYVQLPTDQERHDILVNQTKKTPLHADVDLFSIATDTRATGFSGADMAALVREASLAAIREMLLCKPALNDFSHSSPSVPSIKVSTKDFNAAFSKVYPSVSPSDRRVYDDLHHRFTSERIS